MSCPRLWRRTVAAVKLAVVRRCSRLVSSFFRHPIRCLLALLVAATLPMVVLYFQRPISLYLAYYSRPLWDAPEETFRVIPFRGWSGEQSCPEHGLKNRNIPRRVFLPFLYSGEEELLELKVMELYEETYKFIALEGDRTFQGEKKEISELRSPFLKKAVASGRLLHVKDITPPDVEVSFHDPMAVENRKRHSMFQHISANGLREDDIILITDVDEIPRCETMQLLRWCDGLPDVLNLELRGYVYSFEWASGITDVRAVARRFKRFNKHDEFRIDYLARGQRSPFLLSDAGWHCSFCFRTLAEMKKKMLSYSHADRVSDQSLVSLDHLQRVACEGRENPFGIPPEAYTYKELVKLSGSVSRELGWSHLPATLRRHPTPPHFSFFLPGNCLREDADPQLAASIQAAGIIAQPYGSLVLPEQHAGAKHLRGTPQRVVVPPAALGSVGQNIKVIDASDSEVRVP